MICYGMWSYTQPAGHVASLPVCNLIWAANTDSLWATTRSLHHYCWQQIYDLLCPPHTHTHTVSFSLSNNYDSFSIRLCRHLQSYISSDSWTPVCIGLVLEMDPDPHHPLPAAEHATLAPLRDDVPLLDPCCGQLSAGAEVDLGLKGRTKFIDFHHVASGLWVPPGFRERPQAASNPLGVYTNISEDKTWNSRRIPDAVLRARLGGKITDLYLCSSTSDETITPIMMLCKFDSWGDSWCLFLRSQGWLTALRPQTLESSK